METLAEGLTEVINKCLFRIYVNGYHLSLQNNYYFSQIYNEFHKITLFFTKQTPRN